MDLRFELWTSGRFSERALSLVSARQTESHKFLVQLRDAEYVLAQAVASKDTGLLRTYEQHFIKNPMQEFEEAQKRAKRKAERAASRAKVKEVPLTKATPPPLPTLSTPETYTGYLGDSVN